MFEDVVAPRKFVNSDTGNLYRQNDTQHAINSCSKDAACAEMRVGGVAGPDNSAWGYSERVEWLETQINRAKCQSTQYCFVTQVINSHIIPPLFQHPALITWQILQELPSFGKNANINKVEEGWSRGKGGVRGGGPKTYVWPPTMDPSHHRHHKTIFHL